MSTLLEELNKNKIIEDAVQPNKMSKFAYTEKAYNDNDAAGVDSFNFEAEQNIPSDKISVLQTNETVILKGFRAQASVVPRMLFDHFFGRASYNLNKVHDVVKGVLDAFVKFIGKANGIATLDENGRIPYSQLPESAMEFKGTWDASTNTPTLADGTGDTGDFYVVSVAGTQNLGSEEIKFLENDRVIYSEGVWSKLSAGDVRTVNSIQPTDGNITLTGDDINLSGSDTTKVSTKVTTHIEATTDVHGAVSTSTANKIIIRDEAGRAQVENPSEDKDIANKEYVDTKTTGNAGAVQTALDEHIAKTTDVHGATSEATSNKIAIRDGSGRLQVANPTNNLDATNKQTVISLINELAIQIWTSISDMKLATIKLNAVTYGYDKFVAVGDSAKGAYSTDGITWRAIDNTQIERNVSAVAYGDTRFVIGSNDGKGAYSTDGVIWTAISNMQVSFATVNSITYGNGKFVAVAGSGKGSYSTDGITWTAVSDMKANGRPIMSVTYGDGKFVAVGTKGLIIYSTDGVTWTNVSNPVSRNTFTSIIYGNQKFVAVGLDGEIMHSTDGVTWTTIPFTVFGNININSITYGNGKFVAVASSGKGAYSTDGVIWTAISDLKFGVDRMTSVTYGDKKFVAVGINGKGSYSFNLVSSD